MTLGFGGLFFLSRAALHSIDREPMLLSGKADFEGTPKWLMILIYLFIAGGRAGHWLPGASLVADLDVSRVELECSGVRLLSEIRNALR